MWLERTDLLDEYVHDGEAVVMRKDGRVFALSPLATAALTEVGPTGKELHEVAHALVRRFGVPDGCDGLAATESLVSQLSGLRLLEVRTP